MVDLLCQAPHPVSIARLTDAVGTLFYVSADWSCGSFDTKRGYKTLGPSSSKDWTFLLKQFSDLEIVSTPQGAHYGVRNGSTALTEGAAGYTMHPRSVDLPASHFASQLKSMYRVENSVHVQHIISGVNVIKSSHRYPLAGAAVLVDIAYFAYATIGSDHLLVIMLYSGRLQLECKAYHSSSRLSVHSMQIFSKSSVAAVVSFKARVAASKGLKLMVILPRWRGVALKIFSNFDSRDVRQC